MNHKDFLTEIQRRCGLDRQTTALLLQSAVKLMAEQATEQISVEWEGIGYFLSTKHPEYVAEDPETKQQTLYPPRITYRLSQQGSTNMTGLDAAHFSFHLARYAKASEGDAEFFMHCVTKLILERLDANDPVEIQGLGVFSWLESQQGRRISLQVDEKMRALVNAPFACFEPVVVQESASKLQPESKPEPEPEPEPESEPVPEPVPTTKSKPELEPVLEPKLESEPKPESESTPVSAPAPKPAPELKTSVNRQRDPESRTLLQRIQTLPKTWLYGGIAAGVVLLVLIIWLLVPSGSSSVPVKKGKPATIANTAALAQSEKTDSLASTDSQSAPDTKAPAETPVKSAASAKSATPKEPTDEMLLHENGAPKMDQLSDGERLTLVALRNYGDKAFWAYIYDVNAYQLSNPDYVPVGLPLYLPDPTYFRIDASDPKSIRRAQNRAMQIIHSYERK